MTSVQELPVTSEKWFLLYFGILLEEFLECSPYQLKSENRIAFLDFGMELISRWMNDPFVYVNDDFFYSLFQFFGGSEEWWKWWRICDVLSSCGMSIQVVGSTFGALCCILCCLTGSIDTLKIVSRDWDEGVCKRKKLLGKLFDPKSDYVFIIWIILISPNFRKIRWNTIWVHVE